MDPKKEKEKPEMKVDGDDKKETSKVKDDEKEVTGEGKHKDGEKYEESKCDDKKEMKDHDKKDHKGEEKGHDHKDEVKKEKKTMKEDVVSLFDGEELSEETQSQVVALLEATVADRVETITEGLKAELNEKYETSLDEYASYVAESYVETNKVAMVEASKVEFADKIISSFKAILEEVGVELPEEKVDVHEELKVQHEDLKSELNESLKREIQLKKQIKSMKMEKVVDTVSEGLTVTQKEKFVKLVENVEFDSEDEYTSNLNVIKNKFFSEEVNTSDETEELVTESTEEPKKQDTSGETGGYANFINQNF